MALRYLSWTLDGSVIPLYCSQNRALSVGKHWYLEPFSSLIAQRGLIFAVAEIHAKETIWYS